MDIGFDIALSAAVPRPPEHKKCTKSPFTGYLARTPSYLEVPGESGVSFPLGRERPRAPTDRAPTLTAVLLAPCAFLSIDSVSLCLSVVSRPILCRSSDEPVGRSRPPKQHL